MISIIISSVNKALLNNIRRSIAATIGVPFELIVTHNHIRKDSISKVYNEGAKKAKFPLLCFSHEDIAFHTKDWGIKLIEHLSREDISLVGVLGCLVKTKAPSGVYIGIQELNRSNHYQRYPNSKLVHNHYNPYNENFSEVSTLDGMFLACKKEDWEKSPFDEKGLTRFHGYDVDFSLSQQANGKVGVIYDIDLEHFSFGGNSNDWVDAQLYIAGKWKDKLPIVKGANINVALLKAAEIENWNQFTISLYKNKYKLARARKLTLALLAKKPLQRMNRHFIKQFVRSLI